MGLLREAMRIWQQVLDIERVAPEPEEMDAADRLLVVGDSIKQKRDSQERLTFTGRYGVSKSWFYLHLPEMREEPGMIQQRLKGGAIRIDREIADKWWAREMGSREF